VTDKPTSQLSLPFDGGKRPAKKPARTSAKKR